MQGFDETSTKKDIVDSDISFINAKTPSASPIVSCDYFLEKTLYMNYV